jgi:hypothetical protein
VIFFFETLVDFYQTTRRYIPEYSMFNSHLHENLKCDISVLFAQGVSREDSPQ